MRKIKMSDAELDTLRPSRSSNVKDMFGSEINTSVSRGDSKPETLQMQKDIVHLVTLNEMLTNFLAADILPRFKTERVANYKKILSQFSKMERMNSKNIIMMWQSITHFHSEKSMQHEEPGQTGYSVNVGVDQLMNHVPTMEWKSA